MDFSIELEPFENIIEDILKLVEMHHEETSFISDFGLKFNPDLETYKQLDKNGTMKIFCAFDDDYNLIGYNIYSVFKHPHCKGLSVAMQDLFFVLPEYRCKGVGLSLIKESEEYFKNNNIKFVIQAASSKKDLSSLMLRSGYRPLDVTYIKEL